MSHCTLSHCTLSHFTLSRSCLSAVIRGGINRLPVIDQPAEQPDTIARATFRHGLGSLVSPRLAGDIKMRPGCVSDEPFEDSCRRDRPACRTTNVLHVGDMGFELLVIGLAKRHAPDRFKRRLTGL